MSAPSLKLNAVASPGSVAQLEISTPRRSLFTDAWYRLVRNKASVVSMIFLAFLLLMAIFANVLSPHNPLEFNPGKDYLPPVWVAANSAGDHPDPTFIMGTDT